MPYSLVVLFKLIVSFCYSVKQKRFHNDMVINSTSIDVLQDQNWESIPWKKLQVGDIVKVSFSNSFFFFVNII